MVTAPIDGSWGWTVINFLKAGKIPRFARDDTGFVASKIVIPSASEGSLQGQVPLPREVLGLRLRTTGS